MMNEKGIKYLFYFSSVLLLVFMLFLSKNAGISCDEVLHYDQSVSVYNYFASHGTDKAALNTPVTNLKYYGQSYDNIVTILEKWFRINDVYGFRHTASALAGWLAAIITAIFAISLSDYKGGLFVILLFAVSPTFLGHSGNNLKDIPFALAYIASVFLMLKFLFSNGKKSIRLIIFLVISIAFSISIRAGGLVLICYFFFFLLLIYLYKYFINIVPDFREIRNKFFIICAITFVSWFLSIILWPYALQSPIRNVIESYGIMAHFPSTFRQIFEGREQWSDFMPWYYLPKSMLITIPVIVTAGLVLFFIFFRYKAGSEIVLKYVLVLFTIIFPVAFVILGKSNIYSSWRQFLFLYPGIVLLASLGFYHFYDYLRNKYFKWGLILIIVLLSLNPLKFMVKNPAYSYLYYNEFTGDLKGAYSNYETDYYYISQTEASKWLIEYLKTNNQGKAIVKATYPVNWLFRDRPEVETSYFRYEERSLSDWDYAIVANRYISPYKLKKKIWPPKDALYTIYADRVPIGIVIKRKSKEDYAAYLALTEGKNDEAITHFEKALKTDDNDEMIFYNFAAALCNKGNFEKADSILKKGLELNPDFELILMYLGNIARTKNKTAEAIEYYGRVIRANRKYFEAYVELAKLLTENNVNKARELLRTCLDMSPQYKPAIKALADTYRITDPDIARKYDDLADSVKGKE